MNQVIDKDCSQQLQQRVLQALEQNTALRIMGGNTKAFYGQDLVGGDLSVSPHKGVVSYEPSELVITVRAGTPLLELDALLASQGQMLPFEPPSYGNDATIGGTIACGFSGPRRPFAGSARDFVLGCKVLTGKGDIVSFGGQVMKNVAGYDVARLMVGAMGTLGVLLEISLKVLPLPEEEITLTMSLGINEALDVMSARAAKPLPLSAACYDGEAIALRLSGSSQAIKAAKRKIAGDELQSGEQFWEEIREQQHYFFKQDWPLWRLSLAPATLHLPLQGQWFFDWAGAQRWLYSDMDPNNIRDALAAEGGHATLFRNKHHYANSHPVDVFHPLSEGVLKIHRGLKQAFDPKNILNQNRMYKSLL